MVTPLARTLRAAREAREKTRLKKISEEAIKLKELRKALDAASLELGREIMALHSRGLTYDQIAKHLGRTPKEIVKLAQQARRLNY